MALAHKVSSYGQSVVGNTARVLPDASRPPRREAMPSKRRKSYKKAAVLGFAAWSCVMLVAGAFVYRNSLVLEETRLITQYRSELQRLKVENDELASQLTNAVSVVEVAQWAEAHGMQRNQVARTLQGDPSALAAREKAAAQAVAEVESGFWAQLGQVFGIGGQAAAGQ